MKAIKIKIILLIICIGISTCKKDEQPMPKVINVKGRIIDAKGNPVKDVKVIVGEFQCDYTVTPDTFNALTITDITDSNGVFSINYFDKYPAIGYGYGETEKKYYNCLHSDFIWLFKDGYFTIINSLNEFSDSFQNKNITLKKITNLRVIISQKNSSNGIGVFGDRIFFTSSPYSDYMPYYDNPRSTEIVNQIEANVNYKLRWEIYSCKTCVEKHEDTFYTNSGYKDTLVYKIDY